MSVNRRKKRRKSPKSSSVRSITLEKLADDLTRLRTYNYRRPYTHDIFGKSLISEPARILVQKQNLAIPQQRPRADIGTLRLGTNKVKSQKAKPRPAGTANILSNRKPDICTQRADRTSAIIAIGKGGKNGGRITGPRSKVTCK